MTHSQPLSVYLLETSSLLFDGYAPSPEISRPHILWHDRYDSAWETYLIDWIPPQTQVPISLPTVEFSFLALLPFPAQADRPAPALPTEPAPASDSFASRVTRLLYGCLLAD
jgi:hypothetical protein